MSDFFQVNDYHADEISNDPLHVDHLIAEYVELRNRLKEVEALAGKIKEQRDQIGSQILEFLDSTGQESAKTAFGTAYVSEKEYVSCSNTDGFMSFFSANNVYELVNRTPNSTACR